jgi:hypothetical protein
MELIAGPDDGPAADPTTNPRAELETLAHAHQMIANTAMQRIADF